jgi:hypothetical protein
LELGDLRQRQRGFDAPCEININAGYTSRILVFRFPLLVPATKFESDGGARGAQFICFWQILTLYWTSVEALGSSEMVGRVATTSAPQHIDL